MTTKDIWIIGTGEMALEYAKVLNSLNVSYLAIGRGQKRCDTFFKETGVEAISGGLKDFLNSKPAIPNKVIVAVGVENLSSSTLDLISFGVKNILLEKPGLGYVNEIDALYKEATKEEVNILLAYNRRFYSSVIKAKEIIKADGGVKSMVFEFTEWSHVIRELKKDKAEHHNWFLGNSTHVIDTAFYLAGKPKEMNSYKQGSIDWHPTGSIYTGAGITETNALFSYHANWEGPGRWFLEVITPKHRLIFKPFEMLQIQEIGSVHSKEVEVDYSLEKDFKPGLYKQTKSFLNSDYTEFCDLEEQYHLIKDVYTKMSGY